MTVEYLAVQNPWWVDVKAIERDEKIIEVLSKKHVLTSEFIDSNLLVVGPRQVGKTTFLKLEILDLIKKGVNPRSILFLSCEPIPTFEKLLRLIKLFLDAAPPGRAYIFLDEITFVKGWERAVKFLLDSPLASRVILQVSGSSTAGLEREKFPGRKIRVLEFLPLSFRGYVMLFGSEKLGEALLSARQTLRIRELYESCLELLPFASELSKLFNRYLESGGFPRSAYQLMEEEAVKSETYNIYVSWVLGDISKLNRSERIFRGVSTGIIKNYGVKFSLSSLAKELEIGSHTTVREYLELMEKLMVARSYFQIDPRSKKPLFRKERKAYFIDPFLYRAFKKHYLGTHQLSNNEEPRLVEGVVGEHLVRAFKEVFFRVNKREIDFIVDATTIEVKWTEKPGRTKAKLTLTKSELSLQNERAIIPTPMLLAQLKTNTPLETIVERQIRAKSGK